MAPQILMDLRIGLRYRLRVQHQFQVKEISEAAAVAWMLWRMLLRIIGSHQLVLMEKRQ